MSLKRWTDSPVSATTDGFASLFTVSSNVFHSPQDGHLPSHLTLS